MNIKRDETFFTLLKNRNRLRNKLADVGLTPEESKEFDQAQAEFKAHLALVQNRQSADIVRIRAIMDKYRDRAQLFLGGVPMITSDIIDFIGNDLVVFGLGVFLFMVIALWFFFRKIRWVLLPLLCCGLTALGMIGLLGLLDWRVTVISSNFVSILLIVTMQLTIHLIVRYGELHAENKEGDQKPKVMETVRLMVQPCFYTAITTIAAFSSLVVSGIRPVIDFGWMMTIGICFGFILSFILWPGLLMMMRPTDAVSDHDRTHAFTIGIARVTQRHGNKVLAIGTLLAVWSLTGITQLKVDNRFIDYFKQSTEIYQGMEVIDRELGGTTPMEIILEPDVTHIQFVKEMQQEKNAPAPDDSEEFDDPFGNGVEEDPFEDPFGDGGEQKKDYDNLNNFWFHEEPLEDVEKIHNFLESLPEIGKVQSIATFHKILKMLNEGQALEDYDLQVIRKLATPTVKESLIAPYLSADASQARITMRIVEAYPGLHRKALVEKIERFLEEEMGYPRNRFRVTGMAILYNNMLYSLYDSQITTLGMVFAAILVMFIILFRNVLLAVLAMPPTVLAAGLILGLMGWFGIPLDMMTITIASITIGIGVDDTIHYIHRFQEEFKKDGDYSACVERCHGSIGRAIYYTSVVVTFGFSILALSNFIPTIYFGLLTGLAMVLALINNLTLLPMLIVVFKPLGKPRAIEK